MKIEGWIFPKAVEYLAEIAGIPVDGRRVPRAVVMAQADDAALARWWWRQRWEACRAALDEALERDDDMEWLECCSRMLIGIQNVEPRDRLREFRCEVTSAERRHGKDSEAAERKFTAAWLALAADGRIV